jgi:hypothetical protein
MNRKILFITLALSFTISACSNLLKPSSLYPLPLIMGIVSETAKASTSKQLESEALQYEILTDQQALIISTNQGLVFTFDSGNIPFTTQYNDALLGILPDTGLNDYLLAHQEQKRFVKKCFAMDKTSLQISRETLIEKLDYILMKSSQRIYWLGSYEGKFIDAFNTELQFLWRLPLIQADKILGVFELNEQFHVIYRAYENDQEILTSNTLSHVVVDVQTGTIIQNHTLWKDALPFSFFQSEISPKSFFIESQNDQGVYIDRLQLSPNGSMQSLWRRKISSTPRPMMNLDDRFYKERWLEILNQEKPLLVFPGTNDQGKTELLAMSYTGEICWRQTILNDYQAQLSSDHQTIFLSSIPPRSINELESLILYGLKANNGEQLWTKTLRGIKHQDVNQKSFTRAHCSSGIYVFDQDKKQLIFFSVSGIEKVFSFSVSQSCTASFYSTSKNLYLLLSDYDKMALLFKVTENSMVQDNSQEKLN